MVEHNRNDATTATKELEENRLARLIMDAAFKVHRTIGPGLLESAYVHCLLFELRGLGLRIEHQYPVPLLYGEVRLEVGYRVDIMVERRVIVEVKAVEELHPLHTAQLITYLRLTGSKLGLLINFNEKLLKNGIKRIVNGLQD